jgi:hypothetical protein
MDWNRALLIGSQLVLCCILGGLVASGHDSAVTDALLVISGSIAGVGILQAVVKSKV